MWLVVFVSTFFAILFFFWRKSSRVPNPFSEDARVPRKPYIHDQKRRDAVIKQGFSNEKIPLGYVAFIQTGIELLGLIISPHNPNFVFR